MTALPSAPAAAPLLPGRRIVAVAATVFCSIALLLAVLLARVVQLQVAPGEQLLASMDQRVTVVPEPGVRGDLIDRRGRPLAITCFGQRAFLDPTRLPRDPIPSLSQLADAVGLPLEKVAERVIPAIDKNEKLAADPDAPRDEHGNPKGLVRYLSIGSVLDDSRAGLVRSAKIPGVGLELRSVRETPGDDYAASILGLVGVDDDGLMGAERSLNDKVKPTSGEIRYVRDSHSRPLWMEPGGYIAPRRGNDIRLSIDLELQRIATEELQRGVEDAEAAGGRLVMLDPITGEILAMVDIIRSVPDAVAFPWVSPKDKTPLRADRRYRTIVKDEGRAVHPSLGRNRCVEDVYEPGSTFKPFMWSVVTELGLARPDEVIDTENGKWNPYGTRILKDVAPNASLTWHDVLVKSSNIGMAKVTSRMSAPQMRGAVLRFGFGSKTNIGLTGESRGFVTPASRWSKFTQTSVAMGYEIAVTPLQMVRGFSVFARNGALAGTLPSVHLTAVDPSDSADPMARALPPRIVQITRDTMRGVTANVDSKMMTADPHAGPPKYDWFGKSGTAEIPLGPAPEGKRRPAGSKGYFPGQYNSSFIAGAPVESPRLVVVVVIDDPGPRLVHANIYYGSHVAAPVVRRVLERGLTYLGVPPTVPAGSLDEKQTASR